VKPSGEIYLLTDWGQVTLNEVRDWVKKLKEGGAPWPGSQNKMQSCNYDVDNLELSAEAFRNSIGTKLYGLLEAESADDCSGPEYFKMAMMKVTGTSAQAVRLLSNKLADQMKLREESGENVTVFSVKVAEICKQLVGSGSPPSDMAFLVARAYTHSSDSRWVSFANEITNKQHREQDWKNWQEVIQRYNEEYEARINSNDWPAAASSKSKKESQENAIVALVAKEVNKATAVLKETMTADDGKAKSPKKGGCFNCGGDHFKKDCPKLKENPGGDDRTQPIEAWRKKAPSGSEGTIKTVQGVEYEWCAKCLKSAGLWTKGRTKHGTDKHVGGFYKKKKDGTQSPSSNLAAMSGLQFVDGTLAAGIGFLGKY